MFQSLISLFDKFIETAGFRKASTLKGQSNALLLAERMQKIAFILLPRACITLFKGLKEMLSFRLR